MQHNDKINQVRQLMKEKGLAAVIIPSQDPHKSEYVAGHWQVRQWLTGFTGSAGTAVVTMDRAGVWTDFRYFIQAQQQLSKSGFDLFKVGHEGVPSVEQWLAGQLNAGDVVGLNGLISSVAEIRKLTAVLDEKSIGLDTTVDIAAPLWLDRPDQPASEAFELAEHYAGESRKSKLAKIRQDMAACHAAFHLITTLDDIAWTLNLRGQDVHATPVNISFMLMDPEKVTLFINPSKISASVKDSLASDDVFLADYGEINDHLSRIPDDASILVDVDQVSMSLFEQLPDTCRIIEKANPAIALKAIKNDVQMTRIRETAVKDGVAMVQFLHWLETTADREQESEVSVAEKLYALRCEQKDFFDISFDSIMAYKEHSAICHYGANEETDFSLAGEGMFLTDSGGNYFSGTTDITRTLFFGTPDPQAKTDYTLVLKSHINVARAVFPKGTKGTQIDALARKGLWQQGLDFGHGTGHGVGFFLGVHEGPARISPICHDVSIKAGMLLTNEPGVYKEGCHGIRLENMILVTNAFENEFGKFLQFDNMTLCHFQLDLIDFALITDGEKQWLNTYHQQVYEKIAPHLEPPVAAWLKEKNPSGVKVGVKWGCLK